LTTAQQMRDVQGSRFLSHLPVPGSGRSLAILLQYSNF
jgi:hypothetical protein